MRTRISLHAGPVSVSGGGCGWLPIVLAAAVVVGIVAAVVAVAKLVH